MFPEGPPSEAQRLARLRALSVLDTPAEPVFDGIAEAAAALCGTPIALLSLIDHDRQWFKANIGLTGVSQTPRDVAFCDHAIRSPDRVMVVEDATNDARFVDNPLVTAEPSIRFYAGAPLVMSGGEVVGTLCVIDRTAHTLTRDQQGMLASLAKAAAAALEMRDRLDHVTERARLEDEVRRAGAFLERVERVAGVGGWEADLRTRTVRWTPQTAAIYGLPAGHRPGFDEHRAYYDAEALRVMDAAAQRALQAGEPWDVDLAMTNAAGRSMWVRSVGEAEFEGGVPVRLIGSLSDITASRQQHDALDAAHRLLQAVVEALPCGLSVFDDDLRLVVDNRKFRELLDFPDSLFPASGTTYEQIIAFNYARGEYGDGGTLEDTMRHIIRRARQPQGHVWRRTRPNGAVVEIRGAPMPHGGFVATYIDITEQEQSRAALERAQLEAESSAAITRSTLEATADGILVTGPDREQLLRNQRFDQMWGLADPAGDMPSDEMRTRVIAQIVDPRAYEGGLDAIYGTDHIEGQLIHLNDGRVFERYTRPTRLPQGQLGRVWSFRDVTARQAVEAEIRAARDAAENASRMKTDFLNTISHEIRTPLNGVLGMLELLRDAPLGARERERVAIADGSARQLLTLIDDLLDIGKIEAGQMVLESVPVHLPELLGQLAQLYRERARSKGLNFTLDADGELPEWVACDPVRLKQILGNLLANAIKFTSAGRVGLRVEPGERAGWLRFSVQDTGVGIPEKAVSRLFQRFAQADSSTTRKFGGTGLGLAIVKQLSQLMGGDVAVRSVEGLGSVFVCELPLAAVEPRLAPVEVRDTMPPLPVLRILVAEDNLVNQVVVRGLLEQLGQTDVTMASNGEEACRATRERDFELVLMDCQMPVMDGYEAATALRAAGFDGAIIALTANASNSERARCLAAGMDDFLAKPVTGAQLVLALHRVPVRAARGAAAAAPGVSARVARPAAAAASSTVFDVENVRALMGGDAELAAVAVQAFVRFTPGVLDRIDVAVAAADLPGIRMGTHSLRGSLGTLGLADVAQQAGELEDLAEAGEFDPVPARWERLRAQLRQLVAAADAEPDRS